MADLRKQIDLVFRGVDETGQATQAALSNAARFSESIGNVTQPISDFTQSAVKLEAALITAGAAITAFAIKTAGDFDTAFREIATLIDEPIEALDDFRRAILDYAATSSQSLDQINTAVYSAISAGVDYRNSLDTVAVAERLAIASKADLGDTLTLLVSSLNAYGAGVEEAESFSDALFTTVRQGQTTLPELAGSLAQVTSIAAAGGIEFDELLAAVATLTASGLPTSQAITAIRGAISNIISPTAQARQLAEELGIEFGAQALQSRGLQGVLQDVAEATGGNVEQQSRLFGSVQGLTAVLSLGGESAEMFGNNLDAMSDKAGATEEAFGKMAEGFALANQRIKNNIQLLFNEIGEPLLDAYGDLASAIAAVFSSIGAEVRDGEFGRIVEVIEEVLSDIASTLARSAALIPDLDLTQATNAIIDGINAVRESVGSLFDSFDLGTTQGVEGVINLLAEAFRALSIFTGEAVSTIGGIVSFLADGGLEKVAQFASEWGKTAGAIAGVVVVVNTLLPVLTLTFAGLSKLVGVLAGVKGVGVAGSLVAAKASFSGLATLLAAGGPVAIALGGSALVLGKLVIELGKLQDATRDAELAEMSAAQATEQRNREFERLSDRLGITITDQGQLNALIEDGTLRYSDLTGLIVRTTDAWRENRERGTDALSGITDEGERTEAQLSRIQQALLDSGLSAEQIGLTKAMEDAGDAAEGASEKSERWIKTIVDGVETFTQVGGGVANTLDDVDRKLDDVTQTSEDFRLKVLEIASQEYIATIQARTELDIAQLEAETARVEAAFESINVAIQSSGELLSDLFGAFSGATGLDQLFIQRQIEREEQRRQQAFDQQERLTQAQIDHIRERTRQMARGDAMLTVDGAGLQPHLEAFMWEILRTIQVRVNQDGLDMLLGAPA